MKQTAVACPRRRVLSPTLAGVLAAALLGPALVGADPAAEAEAGYRAIGRRAIRKGAAWLLDQQGENGAWSDTTYPALTALAVWALAGIEHPEAPAAVRRGCRFIMDRQVPHGPRRGAIYQPVAGVKGGGLPNYNTAICIVALAEAGGPDAVPVILKGREFLARSQHLDPDEPFYGGMGYDPPAKRPYADMSNSYLAYQAMWRTASFEEHRTGDRRVDLDWDAAIAFLERCHNHPDVNDRPWVADSPSEQGGFVYRPDEYRPNSGAYEEGGVTKFRSMPGMTYAGLLSYIYAGISRDDPRVRATVDWIARNWQLDKGNRNPEVAGTPLEKEGLYYLYNVMSRGLHAYGRDELPVPDGDPIDWRDRLTRKIAALQRDDGSWINANSRYWEGNPVLVTAYSLLALRRAAEPAE